MALIFVNSATVKSVFFDGKGARIVESFQKRDGSAGETQYTAFFDEPHGLTEGTTGNFSGLHSVKPKTWETSEGEVRASADVILNSARFTAVDEDAY